MKTLRTSCLNGPKGSNIGSGVSTGDLREENTEITGEVSS